MATETPAARPGRWSWVLAAALALFIVPRVAAEYTPNTWLVGDGGFYLNIQKSLTRDFSLDQSTLHPRSWYTGAAPVDDAFSNISLGQNGQWWPKHSYLMPIAALPFYWLLGVPGTLVFNILMMLAMIVVGYHLAREIAPDAVAAVAALVCGLTGPFVTYSYNFSNDGFYTVLALGGLLALCRRRPVLAGVLWGMSIWAKVTCVLLGPMFLAVMVWRGIDRGAFLRFAGAATVPILGLCLANTVMFGAPWITSYHRVLVVQDGALTTASHTDLFGVPMWVGLRHLFGAHYHGLLTAWPTSLIACLGLLALWRSHRALSIGIAVTSVVLILFFAKFVYYQERFLFPWFVLGIVPGAALLQWFADRLPTLHIPPGWRGAIVVGAFGALALLRVAIDAIGGGGWKMVDHLESAKVYLGDRHCDYFNNMRWSWECVGADLGELDFVGINEAQVHQFDGIRAHGLVFVGGHSSRRPRRIVFEDVPARNVLRVRYGLDDASKRPLKTDVRFRVDGERVWRHRLDTASVLYEKALDTSRWAGRTVDIEVVIRTRHRSNVRLVFDGVVE